MVTLCNLTVPAEEFGLAETPQTVPVTMSTCLDSMNAESNQKAPRKLSLQQFGNYSFQSITCLTERKRMIPQE